MLFKCLSFYLKSVQKDAVKLLSLGIVNIFFYKTVKIKSIFLQLLCMHLISMWLSPRLLNSKKCWKMAENRYASSKSRKTYLQLFLFAYCALLLLCSCLVHQLRLSHWYQILNFIAHYWNYSIFAEIFQWTS